MRIPDGPAAARAIRWIDAVVDVLSGILCAVVARLFFPLVPPGVVDASLIAVATAVAWLLGSRRWAVAFAATSGLLAVVAGLSPA